MFKRLTPLLAAGLVVAATAHGAAAATVPVSGNWTATDFGQTSCTPRGSLLVCRTTGFISVYTGDLSGTSVAAFRNVMNCATGRAIGAGTETLTAADGSTLTWLIYFTSSFAPDCQTLTAFDGHGFVVRGTGVFAGARGQLRFTFEGTYSGALRLDRGDDGRGDDGRGDDGRGDD